MVAPEEIPVLQLPTSASNEKTTKHLLVVDDEPHIRDLLRKYLEMDRYTVDLAQDGQEAWRKLVNVEYDCILLDLKMSGMSGQDLYQLMKRTSDDLASKVVFITGDTVSAESREFISKITNPLVTKPFRLE